jgi:formylglycine-generating enzyme required for sulfatase activity
MKRLLITEILAIALVGCNGANANKQSVPESTRVESATPLRVESATHTLTPPRDPPAGMVLVPAASFEFRNDEQKQKAQVSSFYIDRYEVTVGDFNKFLASSGYRTSAAEAGESKMFGEVNSQGPDYPVGFVSVKDAKAYCGSSRKRLPTPQEWQLAALGVDGRQWPWGSWSANYANVHPDTSTANAPKSAAAKVGSFPHDKSPSGAFDMGGNMLEWTTEGTMGGSYGGTIDFQNPRALNKSLDDWVGNTGFRCAADAG